MKTMLAILVMSACGPWVVHPPPKTYSQRLADLIAISEVERTQALRKLAEKDVRRLREIDRDRLDPADQLVYDQFRVNTEQRLKADKEDDRRQHDELSRLRCAIQRGEHDESVRATRLAPISGRQSTARCSGKILSSAGR